MVALLDDLNLIPSPRETGIFLWTSALTCLLPHKDLHIYTDENNERDHIYIHLAV